MNDSEFMERGGKVRVADGDAALAVCGAGEFPYGSAASQSAADGSAIQKEQIMWLLREVMT